MVNSTPTNLELKELSQSVRSNLTIATGTRRGLFGFKTQRVIRWLRWWIIGYPHPDLLLPYKPDNND